MRFVASKLSTKDAETMRWIIERLSAFHSKTSIGEWERDTIQDRVDRSAHEVVYDGTGKAIFDTFNSEQAEIHEEDGHRWDDVGRLNMEFCIECHKLIPQLQELIVATGEK